MDSISELIYLRRRRCRRGDNLHKGDLRAAAVCEQHLLCLYVQVQVPDHECAAAAAADSVAEPVYAPARVPWRTGDALFYMPGARPECSFCFCDASTVQPQVQDPFTPMLVRRFESGNASAAPPFNVSLRHHLILKCL